MKMSGGPTLPRILVVLVFCCLAAGCGQTTIYSPPQLGNPMNAPSVKIIVPAGGQTFNAHQDIRLVVLATPNGTDLGPEATPKMYAKTDAWDLRPSPEHPYSIDFLAGTNTVGTQSASMTTARPHSRTGQAIPMIIGLVGYPAVEVIWHDAPAGTYSLTAKVTNEQGLATTSAPVKITVLP